MAYDEEQVPSIDTVARAMRTRTKLRGASYAGTFLDADDEGGPTNPTATEATGHIEDAADEVYGNDDVGPYIDVPEAARPKVLRAIVWLACANIELSHFTEQGNAGRGSTSPYDRYLERYQSALTEAIAAIAGDNGGGQPVAGALLPRATFPRNAGGMIGNGTEW